jgi:hypothetical protein
MRWIIFYDEVLDILHRWELKVKAHRDHRIAVVATTKKRLADELRIKAFKLDTEAEDLEKLL